MTSISGKLYQPLNLGLKDKSQANVHDATDNSVICFSMDVLGLGVLHMNNWLIAFVLLITAAYV